ncbi:hypothetical protein RJT34_10180 [Clitoria ternatea]|uniref:NAC domain-containing protein n=1 Tax=Clitoria ternatea TaxID=43366 RepID=A0AAN9PWX5_CLITE
MPLVLSLLSLVFVPVASCRFVPTVEGFVYSYSHRVRRCCKRATSPLLLHQKEKEEANLKDIEMEGKDETLPPGFRFHPTDEELITCYLLNKISDSDFTGRAITDVDLNKCEPWELPGKAKMGEKEWYFFSLRDRKYPTGVRTNRATNTGYWKTTGKDKEIFNSVTSELVGMKKTLVFYKGRAPRGEKSNWVMHEYRIHSKSTFRTTKQDEWVVCRVFQKSGAAKKYPSNSNHARAMNPYNLENIMTPSMLQLAADPAAHHFLYGRNYMSSAELAEVTRALRGGGGSSTGTSTLNLPIMQSHLNYPASSTAAPGFTISGLNLNLGGATTTTTPQPILRPMQPSQSQPLPMAQLQHDVSSNMMQPPHDAGYVTEMNSQGNRFMGMEHCVDLDNYWPSY